MTKKTNFISVCDNCTLTLLESSNDLAYYVESESQYIDFDSVPAPWSRLLLYENVTEHLTIKLDEIIESAEKVENYNDLQIDKVSLAKQIVSHHHHSNRCFCFLFAFS